VASSRRPCHPRGARPARVDAPPGARRDRRASAACAARRGPRSGPPWFTMGGFGRVATDYTRGSHGTDRTLW